MGRFRLRHFVPTRVVYVLTHNMRTGIEKVCFMKPSGFANDFYSHEESRDSLHSFPHAIYDG